MRNLLQPKWLLLVNTLPLAILFIFFSSEFSIIKTLLTKEQVATWKVFAISTAILALLNIIYTLFLLVKKQQVNFLYGVAALLCYIPLLYLIGFYSDELIPFSVPQWMITGNSLLYASTFLMPTLIHALFVLVLHFTGENSGAKAGKSFIAAICIPVAWYILIQVILPLWKPVDGNFSTHTLFTFLVTGTVAFLFFLIRGIYIIAVKKAASWKKYDLAWKIPISIVLPLLGLAVNNGHLFNSFSYDSSGVFGNFSNPWFYILALINGILVCLPALQHKWYRTLLFAGRSITLAYTVYFFLVFLPFLPLSVIAIIVVGTGFLMLTPLLLFVIHVNELSKDFSWLRQWFSKRSLGGIAIICFITIPCIITGSYFKDRRVLHTALDYVYSPDYKKKYNINKASIEKTLAVVQHHKDRNRDFLMGSQVPYLSAYFNWLVLDNLTLSEAKVNTLDKIFTGNTSFTPRDTSRRESNVKISKLGSVSRYDSSQKAWISQVDIEIANKDSNAFAEFVTTLQLPEGCWISGYYLYVGDRKEEGILAEKKAALWVYSQITNTNRDPGIVYYLSGNKVALRVFPFMQDEIRKTGIEFLHKEPVKLMIEGQLVELGNAAGTGEEKYEDDNMIYVSAKQKQSLDTVRRKPYFHFIVDASVGKNKNMAGYTQRIEKLCQQFQPVAQNASISFVGSYVNTFPFNDQWKEQYAAQEFEGGFYLDRAVKTALITAFENNSNTYPVIVVVTDSLQYALMDHDLSGLQCTFPESSLFFELTSDAVLQAHSLVGRPVDHQGDSAAYSFDHPVLAYPLKNNKLAYLANNNEPSIILKKPVFTADAAFIKEKNWAAALSMQGMYLSQLLHPEISGEGWPALVKYSFISKVMTPETSYLVVENDAQKAVLKKKQEQAMASKRSLDLGEDTERMDEPGLVLMAILLILFLFYKHKKRRVVL